MDASPLTRTALVGLDDEAVLSACCGTLDRIRRAAMLYRMTEYTMKRPPPTEEEAPLPESIDGPRPRLRPGGRSDRVRESVARACLELLAEGQIDLTAADVAARSQVARSTIYRWWPTPTDLMREALGLHTRRLNTPPDTGTWFGDLHALIAMLAEFLSDPVERAQNSIIASGQNPELSKFLLDYFDPIVAQWRHIVERAIARGEVIPDADPATVVSLVASPMLSITLIERRHPTTDELSQIARLVLRATSVASDDRAALESEAPKVYKSSR